MKKLLDSPRSLLVIKIIGAVLVALVIFLAGIIVGRHQGGYNRQWEMNYRGTFGGPHSPFMMNGSLEGQLNSHGAFGEIAAIDGNVSVFEIAVSVAFG